MSGPQIAQMLKFGDRSIQRARGRERSYVKFINDRAGEGPCIECLIGPAERALIIDTR